MLEISIICVIALAWAYWMALYLMGRREDVLHGNFIHATEPTKPIGAIAPVPPLPLPPVPPPAAAKPTPTAALPTVAMPMAPVLTQTAEAPAVAEPVVAAPARPPRASVAERVRAMSQAIDRAATLEQPRRTAAPQAQPELLHSLLEIIKRDLGEAVSK